MQNVGCGLKQSVYLMFIDLAAHISTQQPFRGAKLIDQCGRQTYNTLLPFPQRKLLRAGVL